MSEEPSIICPRCGRRSYNPNDISERYCGYCHEWQRNMHELPNFCSWCGALLMGGLTKHQPECAIQKIIRGDATSA